MRSPLLVFGCPACAWQKVLDLPVWSPGDVVRASVAWHGPAGKGVNAARAIVPKFEHVEVVGGVGIIDADRFRSACAAEKIPFTAVHLEGLTRTATTLCSIDSSYPDTEIVEPPGPLIDPNTPSVWNQACARADGLAICGSLPPGDCPQTWLSPLPPDRWTILDSLPLVRAVRPGAHPRLVIKLNEREWSALTPERTLQSWDDLAASFPASVLVRTCGARGVEARWESGRITLPAHPARLDAVHAVGAGDAFTAGLLLGLVSGQEVPQALASGLDCAFSTLSSRIPGGHA